MEGLRRFAACSVAVLLAFGLGSPRTASPGDSPPVAPPAASPPGSTTGAPPVVDEASFLKSLEQARSMLKAGRGAEGLRIVQAALDLHKGQDYVRAKRPDLEDVVRRLAFRIECPPPEPQSVVKGKLVRFVPLTGQLENRYAEGKPTDFEPHSSGGIVFPARFRGPFTITVKGDSYPEESGSTPIVLLGMEENQKTRKAVGWAFSFGLPPYQDGNMKRWVPAKITFVDGDDKKVIVEKATSPAEPRKPFRLDVGMTSSRVVASINGNPLGSAPKPDGVFGYAILKAAQWSDIVVSPWPLSNRAGAADEQYSAAPFRAVRDELRVQRRRRARITRRPTMARRAARPAT